MIKLDGKHTSEFGYKALIDHEHPATPDISNKTMSIPGMAGQWDFGAEIGAKPFGIKLRAMESDDILMQQNQNKFIAFLFDDYGKPRNMELIFDYEPGKFYTARLSNNITPSHLAKLIRYSDLPLIAYDPYKYSRVLSDEVTWGSEEITFEWDYLLGHVGTSGGVTVTGPTTFDISVEGLAVQPVFEIEGTANNLKVECGKYSFMLPNFTNAKWEVDFIKYITYKNGLENMIDMDEFFLLPGINEIKVTGSNINIEMRIKFRDKFN